MKNYVLHITIILLIYLGCVPPQNIWTPVNNPDLRNFSDKLIYAEIPEENHKNVVFIGAYSGIQCSPEIEDFDAFFEEANFDKYKEFKCTCYNYKVITEQGNNLYVGYKGGFYLYTRVCFDENNAIVEQPEIDNLKLTSAMSKTKHIDLSKVKSITAKQINQKSKFGKFPALVYQTNQERLLWKVKRHFGKLNVTVYEFEIDAETGEILRTEKLPYRRTFWQWICGTGI